MKTGLVIYSSSIDRLSDFYCHIFGFEVSEHDESYALLTIDGFELVLLETEISKKSTGLNKTREDTPIKPTFFVDMPLEMIQIMIEEKDGFVYDPKSCYLAAEKCVMLVTVRGIFFSYESENIYRHTAQTTALPAYYSRYNTTLFLLCVYKDGRQYRKKVLWQ